jgi:hypothetical protein
VVYAEWERDIPPEKPSGSATIVVENSEYRSNLKTDFTEKLRE